MAVIRLIGLLAIEVKSLKDGGVLHREQDGVLNGVVGMFAPGPRRDGMEAFEILIQPG